MSNEAEFHNAKKAVNMTLHLIGVEKAPDWADPLTIEMCKQVFDANRGKFENELEVVQDVINERYPDGKS